MSGVSEPSESLGLALVALAERHCDRRCLYVGHADRNPDSIYSRFLALAGDAFEGLDVTIQCIEAGECKAGHTAHLGFDNAALIVLDLTSAVDACVDEILTRSRRGSLVAGAQILFFGNATTATPAVNLFVELGYGCVSGVGGILLEDPRDPRITIPKTIHLSASEIAPIARACKALWGEHEKAGWRISLWSPDSLEVFISENFPEFADIYDDYLSDRQRWAAARYLILRRFGGIAVAGDVIPLRTMDELLPNVSAFVGTYAIGAEQEVTMSDEILASAPCHPLFNFIEQDLALSLSDNYSASVGSGFLTRRVRECARFIARESWPVTFGNDVFPSGLDLRATDISGRDPVAELRRRLPKAFALSWLSIPERVRAAVLASILEGGGLDPGHVWESLVPWEVNQIAVCFMTAPRATTYLDATLQSFVSADRAVSELGTIQVVADSVETDQLRELERRFGIQVLTLQDSEVAQPIGGPATRLLVP